jgi:hypothetical protein
LLSLDRFDFRKRSLNRATHLCRVGRTMTTIDRQRVMNDSGDIR